MKKVLNITCIILIVLSSINTYAQTEISSNIKELIENTKGITPKQKLILDSSINANITTLVNKQSVVFKVQLDTLNNKMKVKDSLNTAALNLNNLNITKAEKKQLYILIGAGGVGLLFIIFLLTFIFTKVTLNKRTKEVKKLKTTYDTNIKDKSDYEQSLLKDIQTLTNGYKEMEAKVATLEKEKQRMSTYSAAGITNGTDNNEKEELIKKSKELTNLNVVLTAKVKQLEDKLSAKLSTNPQPQAFISETIHPDSQKILDNIDINLYKIDKLNKLKDSSAISAEEYASLKQAILNKI